MCKLVIRSSVPSSRSEGLDKLLHVFESVSLISQHL